MGKLNLLQFCVNRKHENAKRSSSKQELVF